MHCPDHSDNAGLSEPPRKQAPTGTSSVMGTAAASPSHGPSDHHPTRDGKDYNSPKSVAIHRRVTNSRS